MSQGRYRLGDLVEALEPAAGKPEDPSPRQRRMTH